MNDQPENDCNTLRHFPADIVVVLALPVVVTVLIVSWIKSLHGTAWLVMAAVSFGIAVLGATLLFVAKLPLYRQGRFCSFGIETVPDSLRGFYRWGCRCAIFGCILMFLLLLSSL